MPILATRLMTESALDPIFQRLSLAIVGLPASNHNYADAQVSGDLCLGHTTLNHPNRLVTG